MKEHLEKFPKDGSAGNEEASSLPATIAETEAELTSLAEKKMAAVESEDFDTADKLKARETALKDHLSKLKSDDKKEL